MRIRIWITIIIAFAAVTVFLVSGMRSEDKVKAPEFPGHLTWLNSQPLTLKQLHGKIVLLDFWTYCCINCMHIIPDLKKLEDKYKTELVVIGVHSAKFTNEKDTENIKEAIMRYDIAHPVINDKDFEVWHEYSVHAWPTLVLIDPEGYIVGSRSGEGVFNIFDPAIEGLVSEFDQKGLIDHTPLSLTLVQGDTSSYLRFPGKLAVDNKGKRLFITDSNHNRIVVSNFDGKVLETIGNGEIGMYDGDFAKARFFHPQGICYDDVGDILYVADTENHAIRMIDLATKKVRTLVGTGQQGGWGDSGGVGTRVELNSPWDLTLINDVLYIAMAGSHQLWSFDLADLKSDIFAGTGAENIIDGPRLEAALAQPSGITHNGDTLYFADSEVSAVREVSIDDGGKVLTLIGQGLFEYGDIDGTYPKARLQHPLGVAYRDHYVYIADTYNHKIKKLDPAKKKVETLIGTGKRGYIDGLAAGSELNEPNGLAFDGDLMFITDTNNNKIRVYNMTTGLISTLNVGESADSGLASDDEYLGDVFKINEKTLSPGADHIALKISLAKTLKFVAEAPPVVSASSQDTNVISIGETKNTNPEKTFEFPVRAKKGKTIVTIDYRVYCCSSGDNAVCFFKEGRLLVPVTVSSEGETSFEIKHKIFE